MLCFMDKTYCICQDCGNDKCDSRLTDEVAERAATFGLPVSVNDESKTCRCYVKKTDL